MDIRKKFFSIVGVLALTMSMTAGIVAAQSDGIGVTFVVGCGTANAGTSSATIGRSDGLTDPIAFSTFDAANPGDGTVKTADGAFRVTASLYCTPAAWYVQATISEFATEGEVLEFSGNKFQFTYAEGREWTSDAAGLNPVASVNEPNNNPVTFATDAPHTAVLASSAVAVTNSTMFMDFTGHLVGLDDTILAGDYSATITVTFNPGAAP